MALHVNQLDRTRQQGMIPDRLFAKRTVTLVGAGAIGSFAALTLGKMGVQRIFVWDEDGVNTHNVPNQFYRKQDVGQFKVDALESILNDFTDTSLAPIKRFYRNQVLRDTVIVATDSMASRKAIWTAFLRDNQAHHLIEARMGAQLGLVYTISKHGDHGRWKVHPDDKLFYESRLYDDKDVKPLPCTERTIIYNVLGICSLIGRAYKAILTRERDFPREQIFNLTHIDERTWMFTR